MVGLVLLEEEEPQEHMHLTPPPPSRAGTGERPRERAVSRWLSESQEEGPPRT